MSLYTINKTYWAELKEVICSVHEMYANRVQQGGLRIEHFSHDFTSEWHSDKSGNGKYRLVIGDISTPHHSIVSTWELWPMKNCCGICVSTAVQVAEEFKIR